MTLIMTDLSEMRAGVEGRGLRQFAIQLDLALAHGRRSDQLQHGVQVAVLLALRPRQATAAHAHEFIARLPQGYDTPIGEQGARLSGGQQQRLAIARAFLKDAPFLILDEATSHLDAESEALIQDALDRLLRGRTALIIAHRLRLVYTADRVVVMQQGRAAESGKHATLLVQNGAYRQLVASYEGGE